MEPLGFNHELWNDLGIWALVFSPLGIMVILYLWDLKD